MILLTKDTQFVNSYLEKLLTRASINIRHDYSICLIHENQKLTLYKKTKLTDIQVILFTATDEGLCPKLESGINLHS